MAEETAGDVVDLEIEGWIVIEAPEENEVRKHPLYRQKSIIVGPFTIEWHADSELFWLVQKHASGKTTQTALFEDIQLEMVVDDREEYFFGHRKTVEKAEAEREQRQGLRDAQEIHRSEQLTDLADEDEEDEPDDIA
jgi:hypothetical protein